MVGGPFLLVRVSGIHQMQKMPSDCVKHSDAWISRLLTDTTPRLGT